MPSIPMPGLIPAMAGVLHVPTERGRWAVGAGSAISRQLLPTDAQGIFALTLQGLVIGSAIRVETLAGALIEFRVADNTTEAFNVPAYAAGNPANNLRIKVRKGTGSPTYIPYETQATALVGSQSIFVSQIPDE